MRGRNLSLLKQAVTFIIQNLATNDNLSIITFSSVAQQMYPLQKMSISNRTSMIRAVNSLAASGNSDILRGLLTGLQVFSEPEQQRNPIKSIVLLSNGKDNSDNTMAESSNPSSIIPEIAAAADVIGAPVHTFGFGLDHNVSLLYGLSDATYGTFSFIDSIESIHEAFLRCTSCF